MKKNHLLFLSIWRFKIFSSLTRNKVLETKFNTGSLKEFEIIVCLNSFIDMIIRISLSIHLFRPHKACI